jgi:hypothetical protein
LNYIVRFQCRRTLSFVDEWYPLGHRMYVTR